jgi:hypothetical protein
MIKVWDLNMILNADNDDEKFCIQTYLVSLVIPLYKLDLYF